MRQKPSKYWKRKEKCSIDQDIFFRHDYSELGLQRALARYIFEEDSLYTHFTQKAVNKIFRLHSSNKKNLADYVDIDRICTIITGSNAKEVDTNWFIEASLDDIVAEPVCETDNLNTFESEIISLYSYIRAFTTSIVPTGFGAYYQRISFTDVLATKEISSMWYYFLEESIVSVFAQIENKVSDVMQDKINRETKSK